MILLAPFILLIAIHSLACASSLSLKPPARLSPLLPSRIRIGGQAFVNGSLVLASGLDEEEKRVLQGRMGLFLPAVLAQIVSEYYDVSAGGPNAYQGVEARRKGVLESTLASLLPKCLVAVVFDFLFMSAADLASFAETLYAELVNKQTTLLTTELYDFKARKLREHDFWGNLAEMPLSASLVLMHMLWEGWHPHSTKDVIEGVAKLVAGELAVTAYFEKCYFQEPCSSLMPSNVDLREWPQALMSSPTYWRHLVQSGDRARALEIWCLFSSGKMESAALFTLIRDLSSVQWLHIFAIWHTLDAAFSCRFFNAAIEAGISADLFIAAALQAVQVDPAIKGFLARSATRKGWVVPVFGDEQVVQKPLEDDQRAGGDVHMQPLVPFVQNGSIYEHHKSLYAYVVSPSGKTAVSKGACLCIARGNALQLRATVGLFLYIRKFDRGAVSRQQVPLDKPITAQLQHGDVLALSNAIDYDPLFQEKIDCTKLSPEESFERLKQAFFFSQSCLCFLAIVESDRLTQRNEKRFEGLKRGGADSKERSGKEGSRKRKKNGKDGERGSTKAEKMLGNQQQNRKQRQGRRRKENVGQDQVQPS